MSGQFCRVEPIDSSRHGEALYAAYAADREGRLWTYLPWGPYCGPEELGAQIDAVRASGARPEYALIDLASGKPFGQASYLNIDPAAGSIEVGGIVYAPAFQRGIAATEAMYLMMRHASMNSAIAVTPGSAIRSMPNRGAQQSDSASL
jgi:RimJ/RimL family protein N-acetyltransferase